MTKFLWAALLGAALVANPVAAGEKRKSGAKKKLEAGASCKAPAAGRCAACSITCQVGETAHCGGGVPAGDMCNTQPVCKCSK